MKRILSVFAILLFFATSSFSLNTTVTTQMQWNTFTTIPAGDTVFIAPSATIVNTTMPGIAIIGTLVNYGSFTMSMSGAGIAAIGSVINYGTFVVAQGLSVIGLFINVGILDVMQAAIVIQDGGMLYNTGMIMNGIDIQNNGVYANCGSLTGNAVSGLGDNGSVPIGTPCNDGDANTSNDVIVAGAAACTCLGAAPIPTLSQWGLIVLAIGLGIFGLVAVRQRSLIGVKA